MNGNAWIRPALVVTQRGQSVYLHTYGDLKKIAACWVKPYELVHTETAQTSQNTEENTHPNTKEVILENGLEDVENMYTTQLNDYFYNSRKKTCTQLHIHNKNYTIHDGTKEEDT